MRDLVAVVPYRAGRGHERRRNAHIVLHWLESAGIRTVVAEHADHADPDLRLPANAGHVFIPANGSDFSKAIACNAGFRIAQSPRIALVDADTLMPADTFLECAASLEDFDVIRPFGRLVELDESTTEAIAAGAAFPDAPPGERDDDRTGEQIPLCGGLVIMRSQAYEAVGGMDEGFIGWGGEDDALSVALARREFRCGILDSAAAFHLAHPRTVESRYGHEHYDANRERARWWHEASVEELTSAMQAGAARLRATPNQ